MPATGLVARVLGAVLATYLLWIPVRDGAFTSNDARVRAYALQKTMRSIDLGHYVACHFPLEVGESAVPTLGSVELHLGHRHRPVKVGGRRSMAAPDDGSKRTSMARGLVGSRCR